jgi:hypothetical protein
MPFKSEKQRRFLHANEPEIAKRWEKDYENEEEEIKVGSTVITNYGEVVMVDEIDNDSDIKGRPIYMGTDKDGGEHILYPDQIHAVTPEDEDTFDEAVKNIIESLD